MEISPVQTGCVHLQRGSFSAIFGCPSEILKTVLSKKLPVPECVVLPDTTHHGGVSLVALEFPFYHFLFIQGGLSQGRKYRVIGTKAACDRMREMLRVTLLGPTDAEMKHWKINKNVRETLRVDLDYLALKDKDGHILQIDDMIDFVTYDQTGTALLHAEGEEALYVRRLGNDRFAVLGEENSRNIVETIVIPKDGKVAPPYEIPMSRSPCLPSNFSITLLGASNGFDPSHPTTCYLLWINGVGVLWDCAPFAGEQLKARGVPREAVQAIILTHVHDDHCSFLEFLLDRQKPRVITTREIFECFLIKMGAIVGESPDQVREYVDFTEIQCGRPTKLYGAEFNFRYGVHSIPAFGAEIAVQDKTGMPHRVYFSGDTLHFKGLDDMKAKGFLTPERDQQLREFLRRSWDLCVLDGGGGAIHMEPQDFANSELRICITHRSSFDGSLGPNTHVAKSGETVEIVPAQPVHPYHAQAILEALQLFDVKDRTWIDVLMARGRLREVAPGEVVVEEGTKGDTFYFVLAGNLDVWSHGQKVTTLARGDFFGEIAILQGTERTATVKAAGPSTLFELPGALFMDFVTANNLREAFSRLWRDRQYIQEVELFAGLDARATHRITLESESRSYKKGEQIVRENEVSGARNIFIVKKGAVRLYERGKMLKDERGRPLLVKAGGFFGKNVQLGPEPLRRYAAVADTAADLLVLDARKLDQLQHEMPLVRHRIRLTMDDRKAAGAQAKSAS
ncbi:MAG: cyclic nucleotide-binding domain-containing protein [Bdellovibrionota bacterium]